MYPSEHRSVYLMVQRLHPHPYLALFNGPDTSVTTAVRDDGFLPFQALYLLEQPVRPRPGRAVRGPADRSEPDPAARIRLAYLMVYAGRRRARKWTGPRHSSTLRAGLAEEGVPADRRAPEPGRAWHGCSWRPMNSSSWIEFPGILTSVERGCRMDHGPGSARDRYWIVRKASLGLLVLVTISLVPPWFRALVPDPLLNRLILRSLLAAQAIHGVLLVTLPVAFGALGVALWRARSRGVRCPALVRGFVLCVALMFSLITAEGIAAVWLAWTQVSTPRLPTRFPDAPAKGAAGFAENTDDHTPLPTRFADIAGDEPLDIVVLGESSACGFPYHDWLSMGHIVAWKLREAIPNRRFRLEVLARLGSRLDSVHDMMSGLERRPDLVILYVGHNEFDSRYDWNRTPLHYDDQTLPARVELERSAYEYSPLARLIQQTIGIYRVLEPPPLRVTRPFVDVPVVHSCRIRGAATRLPHPARGDYGLLRAARSPGGARAPSRERCRFRAESVVPAAADHAGGTGPVCRETSRPRVGPHRPIPSGGSPPIVRCSHASPGSPRPTTGWLACSRPQADGKRRTSTTWRRAIATASRYAACRTS